MPAGPYKLIIEEGATLAEEFVWKDADGNLMDLTGYTARSKVKDKVGGTTIIEFGVTVGFTITLGGAAGTITLNGTAAATELLDFDSAVWDLELESPTGEVTRLLKGPVEFERAVSN